MLPNEVHYLIRHEQYKDLLWEAARERMALAAERPASPGLWQTLRGWMPQRVTPHLVIPTFHLYSK